MASFKKGKDGDFGVRITRSKEDKEPVLMPLCDLCATLLCDIGPTVREKG